ncbi:uncharacterized protein LAESUDRAFT_726850 [Laetiporus sulphureus 93-53]|uniref:Chromatin modification-related protein n=1 Tax=Laetiporus sulphureus 93-53 TaxID=1314785 RepID=A0A165DT24_9APHY|nr:uncharacterized protein LAESUDRAFT_726850 [Laetiporus sulphureus 93-53]KZT05572.1 hypothetical protein LAESUDRAFT_726850 [Laetiporus sulphureus 93-53]
MNANLEEAASIAAEYISSLDNLPNETQHLLAEIKHRDIRSHELQQEIQKESAKYIRHSLRSSAPGQILSPKDGAIPHAIAAHYAEIDQLAAEKIALSERMVKLVQRARARLDHDLSRVLVLQGDVAPEVQAGYYASLTPKTSVEKINESLKSAITIREASPSPAASSGPLQKRRRVGATASAGSIKLPSPAPMSVSSYGMGQRSRLSQQVHTRQSPLRTRRVTASVGLDADEDAEGEEDLEEGAEEGGDAEDKELYCFCQKLSYGEMIGCDNPNCRYQWFHLNCVNLKPPLPENWFCEECTANMKKGLGGGAVGGGRKGRKK